MWVRIVEIPELTGPACKIYSIAFDDDEDTLFDSFLDSMDEKFAAEVDDIWYTLEFMGREGGARIQFFREDEGRPGDGIVALLRRKCFSLRLYCIRYGSSTLVLGNGGYKPPSIRAWQNDRHLKESVNELMWISSLITERIKNKDIELGDDGSFKGELVFETDTEK